MRLQCSERGACGNNRNVAARNFFALIQNDEITRFEAGNAMRVCFKIVDEKGLFEAQRASQFSTVDDPGQVRELCAVFLDWPGDAEARGVYAKFAGGQKVLNDLFKARMTAAWKGIHGLWNEPPAIHFERGQIHFGPADVACKNHPEMNKLFGSHNGKRTGVKQGQVSNQSSVDQ
jgi:hypothetical protein